MVSPYLGPAGMSTLRAGLAASAQRGAWIRLVTGELDVQGTNRAALAVLAQGPEGDLIRGRLRILAAADDFPVLLHAKIVVVDGERGYMGSANLSGRALDENLEVGTAVDPRQAKALEDLVAYLEAEGRLVDRTELVFN